MSLMLKFIQNAGAYLRPNPKEYVRGSRGASEVRYLSGMKSSGRSLLSKAMDLKIYTMTGTCELNQS